MNVAERRGAGRAQPLGGDVVEPAGQFVVDSGRGLGDFLELTKELQAPLAKACVARLKTARLVCGISALPFLSRSAEALRVKLDLVALAPILNALFGCPCVEWRRQLSEPDAWSSASIDFDAGVIVLLVQKVTVWSKNPLRDNHLKIRPFSYRRPSGAGNYASGTLVAGRAVAARA